MRSALFLFAIFAIAFSQHIGVDRMYGDLPGYPVELTEDPTWQACEKLNVLLVHCFSPVCFSFLEIFLLFQNVVVTRMRNVRSGPMGIPTVLLPRKSQPSAGSRLERPR